MRIKCHQFMTYQDVEFEPEAGLNCIIGPNGAGKYLLLGRYFVCVGMIISLNYLLLSNLAFKPMGL